MDPARLIFLLNLIAILIQERDFAEFELTYSWLNLFPVANNHPDHVSGLITAAAAAAICPADTFLTLSA